MALTETVLQAGRGSLARVSVLVSLISALGDHSDPPAHGNSLINSAFYGPLSLPSSLPLHHALTLTPSPLSLTTHSFICHLPPSTVSCVFFAFVAHSCSFFCDYCDAAFRHLIFLRASCLSLCWTPGVPEDIPLIVGIHFIPWFLTSTALFMFASLDM